MSEQKTNIEQFEKYINALTRMYLVSLETNENTAETVRTEFDALLHSKDATIQGLQEQLTTAKKSVQDFTKKVKSLEKETVELKASFNSKESDYTTQITNLQSMLVDKDSLNKALSNSYKEEKQKTSSLQQRLDSLDQELKELSSVQTELSNVCAERDRLLSNKETLEKELQSIKASHDQAMADLKQQESLALEQCKQQSQLELEKTILSIERKYQEQIQSLKEKKQVEVDAYQQKYFTLLEKLQSVKKQSEES